MRGAIPTTLAAAFVFAPTVALAHAGHGDTSALLSGFAHPLTGIDHVLAMVAVGVLAAQFSGLALRLIPLSFVGIMAVGGALGMAGILLPFAELGVALSVVILGLAIAFPFRLRTLAATDPVIRLLCLGSRGRRLLEAAGHIMLYQQPCLPIFIRRVKFVRMVHGYLCIARSLIPF